MPYKDEYDDEYEGEDDEFLDEDGDSVILACEDCDYRWRLENEAYEDEDYFDDMICPMCGSSDVVEI